MPHCSLCDLTSDSIIVKNNLFRIVLVNDADYPGFLRLILNSHIKEMSDLSEANAYQIFKALYNTESIVKKIFAPDKMNLASLGNVVPHVHWHIIPRYKNDKHYPNPIWGEITNKDYKPNEVLFHLERRLIYELKHELYQIQKLNGQGI